ncbi:MAG TPA: hypothetical protein VMV52_02370 [Candidatus Nanopelagicaceae bacterium]|nr:hypothetical protein [Candidatus Nanopelagicaceae bacterium]
MITLTKTTKIILGAVVILVVGFGARAITSPKKLAPNLAAKLASCKAFPNDSKQNVFETTRLTIKLPKDIYPGLAGSQLKFKTVNGTATAGWVSNAGPMSQSHGVTANCWSYYYEFDGTGEVDLTASSSIKGIPNYLVRFIVGPVLTDQKILYRNDQYGFTVELPKTWQGYSVLTQHWIGYATGGSHGDVNTEKGPQIIIRNPQWTTENNWQPIPIMVFTLRQWNALQLGSYLVSAAPIPPSELSRNARYVFALPPRYNYAFTKGWREVEMILQSKPLHAF